MSFTLVKSDKVQIIGDSITSGYVNAKDAWHLNGNFLQTIKNTWINPPAARALGDTSGTVATAGNYPTFTIDGVAGRSIGDVSGIPNGSTPIMNHVAAGTTKAIVQLAVNSAFNGDSNNTITPQVNRIISDLTTNSVTGGLWIGSFSHGEHWPSGAGSGNDIDVAIDRVEALLAGLIPTFVGWDYVSWRTVFNQQEPIRNPSNAASGVFTSDGTHPRYQDTVGMGLLINAILAKINVA